MFQLDLYKKLSIEANYRYDREMKSMKDIVDEVRSQYEIHINIILCMYTVYMYSFFC
jgi:hypothetical protein